MDEIEVFQVWIFGFLFSDVFSYALEYLFGVRPGKRFKPGGNAAMDIQTSMALGISWHVVFRGDSTVCIWFLQRNADLYDSWLSYNAVVQTPLLVCVLPDGDNDAVDM